MTVPASRLDLYDAHRVVTPHVVHDSTFELGIDSRVWGSLVAVGGTVAHSATDGSAQVSCTGSSGSSAKLRTHRAHRRGAGAIRQGLSLVHSDAGAVSQRRRWGRFDDNDGAFFELLGTALRVVTRSSVSGAPNDVPIPAAQWNAKPGYSIDLTIPHLFEVAVEGYHGAQRVRFFVDRQLVHTVELTASLQAHAKRSALPVSVEVEAIGGTSAGWIRVHGSAVISSSAPAPGDGVSTDVSRATAVAGVPLASLRLAAGAGSTVLRPRRLGIIVDGSPGLVRLVRGGTLTGASWAAVGATQAEVDVVATVLTGGVPLGAWPVASSQALDVDLEALFAEPLSLRYAATPQEDVLTVVGVSLSGTPTARFGLAWGEVR